MRVRGSLMLVLAVCAGLFPRPGIADGQDHADRKVINRVAAVYPALARRMHVGGVVKLEVAIRANGSVKSTRAVGGNPVLIGPATEAVRQWKFEAAPGETTEVVQIVFEPR
jgi:TonB family protein